MTYKEARDILKKINNHPDLTDQFTEEEIEELQAIVNNEKHR